jgi:hypothetical protein
MGEHIRPEHEQKPPLKSYNELDVSQKLKAVISTIKEPLGKDSILHFAGIDLTTLEDEDKKALEQVFNTTKIDEENKDSEKYWVPLDKQGQVHKELGVDAKTVHGQISDVMMKDIFGEDSPF